MQTREAAAPPPGGALAGDRSRVLISSDIGGNDPDDFQSCVHLLVYADVLEIEGLVSSPPHAGRAKDFREVLDAYEQDLPALAAHSAAYPTPDALRSLVKQGAIDTPSSGPEHGRATEGSEWIVKQALRDDPRPLYVLVWGSITDVAQAVHDAPRIAEKIRVYYISSWNTRNDPASRDYLYREHADLWWIESDTTFRGMYVGGDQSGDLENAEFLRQHVRGHGALGDLLVAKKADIKMGDSPSVLYMLRGEPADPTSESWGGRYRLTEHAPTYWTDDPAPEQQEGKFPGARTVNRWREQYLRHWQARMDRCLPAG